MSEAAAAAGKTEAPSRPRHDPPPAPVDGHLRADEFEDKSPERHYVAVHKGNAEQMEYYQAMGYVVETYRKGGPRPKYYRAKGDGAEIDVMGHVLMSCPIKEYLARQHAQWDRADKIDERILQPGGPDALRGIRGVQVLNESTAD